MSAELIIACILIFLARIADVSLGTLRTLCVVSGRGAVAWVLGFFEVLVWILAVSQVIHNLTSPPYILAYCMGYATGNYVGVLLDRWLAWGNQIVRVFTSEAAATAAVLRQEGYIVTEFTGAGEDGPVSMLFLQSRRKFSPRVLRHVATIDPNCSYFVDDIRSVKPAGGAFFQPTGWRAVLKKK